MGQAGGGGGGGAGGGGFQSGSGSSTVCSSDSSLCIAQIIIAAISSLVGFVGAIVAAIKFYKNRNKCIHCCCHEFPRICKRMNKVQPGALTIQ